MKVRVLPLGVLLLLVLGLLVLMAEAWNTARTHDRRRSRAISTRVQHERVPPEAILAGMRRAVAHRDLVEVELLHPIVLNLGHDPAELRASGIPRQFGDWLAHELRRDQFDASLVMRLCDLLEDLGGEAEAEVFRREYAVRMAPLRQLTKEFLTAVRRFEPYRGMPNSRGRLRHIDEVHDRLLNELARAGLDPADDPTIAAALDHAREMVWDHADRLLQIYRDALHLIAPGRIQRQREIIRNLNRDRPGHFRQLIHAAEMLSTLGWRGNEADPDVRLFALVTSCRRGGGGFIAVLLIVLLAPALTALATVRMILLGAQSVDSSAETLQNVDPVDLDTEGITRAPSMSTTAGASGLESTGPEEEAISGEEEAGDHR